MTLKDNRVKICVFSLIFNLLWLIRVFLVPKTQSDGINAAITIILKFFLFVVFSYLYVKVCYKENPLETFKLDRNIGRGVLYGLISSMCIAILAVLIFMFSKGSLALKGLGIEDLFFTFVFAAFMEEVPFRGVILGKLNQLMGFGKADFITSLLFVFIHIPQYIAKGILTTPVILNSIVIIFFVSLISGFIYKKSNSLWSVIIFHGVWDCAVHVLGF